MTACPTCHNYLTSAGVCPRCARNTDDSHHTVNVKASRSDVVAAAREAIGWPFKHMARSGSEGIDCVGLLFHIARTTGLIDNLSLPTYYNSLRYSRHPSTMGPDAQWLLRELSLSFIRKPKKRKKKGDIVYCRNRRWVHVGIITPTNLIHAYAWPHMKVMEHVFDEKWERACVAAFGWPGVEE